MVVLAIVALGAASANADPFINPPETHWPDIWTIDGVPTVNEWMTEFPYQRNIRYTFDNSTVPLAPHYEGYDDPTLFPSDFVEVVGLNYFAVDPLGGARVGLYGIDNRQGSTDLEGYLLFHLDNWQEPRPWKHIWKEIIYILSDPTSEAPKGAYLEENCTVPAGYDVKGAQTVVFDYLADDWFIEDWAVKVQPNCPWEEIIIRLHVPAGGYALIDDVHFATECVPEPATVTVLALGGGALAWWRRRRNR